MPLIGTPPYPVVDPNPSLGKAMVNYSLADMGYVFGLPVMGATLGYLSARKPFRVYQFTFIGGIGLMAGLFTATLRSTQRFQGWMPNDSEIRSYGAMDLAEVEEQRKRSDYMNIDLVDAPKLKK
jgi:hypothetical protein